jgi:hypothetical protein
MDLGLLDTGEPQWSPVGGRSDDRPTLPRRSAVPRAAKEPADSRPDESTIKLPVWITAPLQWSQPLSRRLTATALANCTSATPCGNWDGLWTAR